MPRSPALTNQTLIALGPECLAELLLELAGSDPAIKRRIRLAVANATSPGDGPTHNTGLAWEAMRAPIRQRDKTANLSAGLTLSR